MPSVNALYDRYKARGLEVRLIAFREAPVLLDESGETTGRDYGVFGPPTVYLIDRAGNLVGRVVGSRAWNGEAARRLIEQLLGAPTKK